MRPDADVLALLSLAGFSLTMRFVHIGAPPRGPLIDAIKAALVLIFSSKRSACGSRPRVSVLLSALLFALVLADLLTRWTPPLQNPPGSAQRDRGWTRRRSKR